MNPKNLDQIGNNFWEDILKEELGTIQQMMSALPSLAGPNERTESLKEVEKQLRSATGTFRVLTESARLAPPTLQQDQRCLYQDDNLNQWGKKLYHLQEEFSVHMEENRKEVIQLRGADRYDECDDMDAIEAGDLLLREAQIIQDRTAECLARIRKRVEDTRRVKLSARGRSEKPLGFFGRRMPLLRSRGGKGRHSR